MLALVVVDGGRSTARLADWPYIAEFVEDWIAGSEKIIPEDALNVFRNAVYRRLVAQDYRSLSSRRIAAVLERVTAEAPFFPGGDHNFALRFDQALLRVSLRAAGLQKYGEHENTLSTLYRVIWIASSTAVIPEYE